MITAEEEVQIDLGSEVSRLQELSSIAWAQWAAQPASRQFFLLIRDTRQLLLKEAEELVGIAGKENLVKALLVEARSLRKIINLPKNKGKY